MQIAAMPPIKPLLLAAALAMPAHLLAEEPVWPGSTVFSEPPAKAVARRGSSCAVAERYVTLIAEDRAPDVVELFAENGSVFSSLPRYLIGKPAIAAQYANVHNKGAIPVSYLESPRECAVTIAALIEAREAGGARRYGIISMNHFMLDSSGKIERLIIYVRPDAIARMPR
jgi:hypothetical protein